ncbi:MAG: class I SAM-dependent methyltransferase [Chthoniobacterales bacterium]|nr:class I SAM-dependent methyltransferase [Chthoniobacterales bacterium]
MARKPAADKKQPDAGEKPKSRRKPAVSGPWLPPPLPWILRAGRSTNEISSPARILCTGLTEAFLLAANLRDAEIVALNRDAETIKAARTAAGRRRLRNLRFEEANLDQPALGELIGGNFDLVVAHDALHRAKDADAAFLNLAAACAPDGTVYASVRSAAHPASRLHDGMAAFGLEGGEIDEENNDGEAVIKLLAGLGGFLPANTREISLELKGEGTGPAPLAAWLDRAGAAGLNLRATTLTAKTLPASLSAGGTKLLSSFLLPRLAILLDQFLAPASVEMVFSRQPVPAVPWDEPEALLDWRPVSRFLPLGKLQEMGEPWNGLAGIEVEITGVLAPQNFTLSHYLVELIRRSDGQKTLSQITAEIPHEISAADLVGALHFLHHSFILELQEP